MAGRHATARGFEKVPFDRSAFRTRNSLRPLTNSRVYACPGAGKFGSRACRIKDDPGGNDHDDQQPKRILTDSAQNHRRRFRRFALIASNVGQYITISVKFLGQHRHFGLVPAIIYVARQADKTIVGTFNVQPTTNAFFPVLGCGQMVSYLELKSSRFTEIRRERNRLRTIAEMQKAQEGPFNIHTASFAALTGRALTIFRAGLALNIIGSPVKGFVPARALVAGFLITTNLANPGSKKTPAFFSSL